MDEFTKNVIYNAVKVGTKSYLNAFGVLELF